MPYITLGDRVLTAALDTTGYNAGNYTNFFSNAVLDSKVARYEVYSMSVISLPSVATVTVYQNNAIRSTAKLIGNSEWDPSQPILMKDGDELAICWDFGTGTPPQATIWLRYDPTVEPKRHR